MVSGRSVTPTSEKMERGFRSKNGWMYPDSSTTSSLTLESLYFTWFSSSGETMSVRYTRQMSVLLFSPKEESSSLSCGVFIRRRTMAMLTRRDSTNPSREPRTLVSEEGSEMERDWKPCSPRAMPTFFPSRRITTNPDIINRNSSP